MIEDIYTYIPNPSDEQIQQWYRELGRFYCNSVVKCKHAWIDAGSKKTWCKKCNCDGVWENGIAIEVKHG